MESIALATAPTGCGKKVHGRIPQMRIDPEIAQSFRPLTRLDFAFRAHVGLGSNSASLCCSALLRLPAFGHVGLRISFCARRTTLWASSVLLTFHFSSGRPLNRARNGEHSTRYRTNGVREESARPHPANAN